VEEERRLYCFYSISSGYERNDISIYISHRKRAANSQSEIENRSPISVFIDRDLDRRCLILWIPRSPMLNKKIDTLTSSKRYDKARSSSLSHSLVGFPPWASLVTWNKVYTLWSLVWERTERIILAVWKSPYSRERSRTSNWSLFRYPGIYIWY